MEKKNVQCPACKGRAVVKQNRVDDSFLSCSRCGAWNGRGKAYRDWCESLPALPEPTQVSQPVTPANDEEPEEQLNWLEAL